MAALEDILVSDLNKMGAEEFRSRGYAVMTDVAVTDRTFAEFPKRHQTQGSQEPDRRAHRKTQV